MAKLTYRAQNEGDPVFVVVAGVRFEHGKSTQVSDEIANVLKGNPWFTGGQAAKDAAAEAGQSGGSAPGPASGIDSSVVPAYPPGSGMKYGEEAVTTADGIVPAGEASLVDGANTVEDDTSAKGRGRSKS